MPHITLEYSKNITETVDAEILKKLSHALAEYESFNLKDVKSRAVGYDAFSVADGGAKAFLHIHLALMPGRSKELLQKVTGRLLQELKGYFTGKGAEAAYSYSVEVRELEKDTYAKDNSAFS